MRPFVADPSAPGWLWSQIDQAVRFYLAPLIWLWRLVHR